MSEQTQEGLDLAKAYAAAGYPVFPVRTDTKAPWTKSGFKDATTDISVIERWWKQRPEARVGVSVGPAGVVVVDLDVKEGQHGPANWDRLSGGLSSPWEVETPSKGWHLWFRNDAGWTSHNNWGAKLPGVVLNEAGKSGVDIKTTGGYVVAYGPPPDVELPSLPLLGMSDHSADALSTDNTDHGDLPLSWDEILIPHGYSKCNEIQWSRPGKTCAEGISLGIIPERPWLVNNFSGTKQLPAGPYSKERLYKNLNPEKPLPTKRHRLQVTKASELGIARTRWFWDERIAMGTLALLAGRQDIGKSTLGYKIAAEVTNGLLPGEYFGTPRGVIIVATEDAWRETINPRLLASGADMDLVYKVEASDPDDYGISLPTDIEELAEITRELECSLILLDPLMSRVDKSFDTHKDSEVRKALEPLVKMAELAKAAVIGLIHVNKGGGTDALNSIMASAAFTAVARAVLFVVKDPENETDRIMGQVKNNLGKGNLPELRFCIAPVEVGWDEGPIIGTTLTWKGEVEPGSIQQILSTKTTKSKVDDAALWLSQYLNQHGRVPRDQVIDDSDYPEHTLKRALKEIGGISEREGFPSKAVWYVPGQEIIAA
jgi:hypothetical protein